MAEWKKIIVSGSGLSQLDNDSGYLTSFGSVTQHNDVTTECNYVFEYSRVNY